MFRNRRDATARLFWESERDVYSSGEISLYELFRSPLKNRNSLERQYWTPTKNPDSVRHSLRCCLYSWSCERNRVMLQNKEFGENRWQCFFRPFDVRIRTFWEFQKLENVRIFHISYVFRFVRDGKRTRFFSKRTNFALFWQTYEHISTENKQFLNEFPTSK